MAKFFITLLEMFILLSCSAPTAEPTAIFSKIPISVPTIEATQLPAQQLSTITPRPNELPAAGEIALLHVDAISNGIGARPAGSEQEAQTLQYIISVFEKLRIPSQVQPFTVTVDGNMIQSANVMAVKYGASGQEIIVGAHYDSVKVGQGADDNASGVSVVLEVAERLRDQETPYTVRFILFGAEELGLEGSKYYVSQMTEEQKQNTLAMINLDSVSAGDFAYVYGDAGERGAIRNWTLEFAKNNKLTLQTQPGENLKYPAGTAGDWSDHAAFKAAGIPYTSLEATNWTLGDKDGYTQVDPQYGEAGKIWHTSYDTLEYINTTFPGRVQKRLALFVTVLEAILTKFQLPS
jgi:Zn-dependent M28 family amino/carboxypeptidase